MKPGRIRDRCRSRANETRGVSHVVGVLVLVALTVCLAVVIAVGLDAWSLASSDPTAAFQLSVDANRSAIVIEHVAGDPIDVERLSMTISVNNTALTRQPPVPFVGATGFDGAPDGPFNAKADSEWTAGEHAGVSIAKTNSPELTAGDSVTVSLVVDDRQLAKLETTAT
ncbi:type IV pilin [Natrinema halophilum]|uniref:Type IV pilin n=1 Tax=Natrinema halophilum TaxID=1699371 RepID=A0A7D5KRN3_9EURY|nr:type IV pilin [Natrinema halophilum]QLG49497.1 type IV pilin [Natrinema halophilum]